MFTFFNDGRQCGEEVLADSLIGIPDILWCQGEENLPVTAVGEFSCQHVEEEEERGLSSTGDGNIFGVHMPSRVAV